MFADEGLSQAPEDENSATGNWPIALPLFAVQLRNIIPLDITARRFPSATPDAPVSPPDQGSPPNVQLNIEEPVIETEKLQAQVVMNVQVLSTGQPYAFEISLKLLGSFTYAPEYDVERVRTFLRQGTLSVMLPVARDLLMNLSAHLQVPLIVLPLVQLAPPPVTETGGEYASH